MPRRKDREIFRFVAQALAAWLAIFSAFPSVAWAQQSASWANDADGDWGQGANWVGGVPASGTGNTATFSLDLTAPRTITLDGSFTIGNLIFNDTGGTADSDWILAGPPGNSLTLSVASGTPTITTTSPLGQSSVTIGAILSGTQGLLKNGPGRLVLTGTNTISGGMTIAGGVLRADALSLPGGNLTIGGGGVYETFGSLTRNLGTGATELRITNTGGFSAAGGNLSVSLNSGSGLTWGSTSGFLTGNTLVLGATNSEGRVDFQNALDLNGTSRTIQVDGAAGIVNASILGNITNGGASPAGIAKTGTGVLELAGTNTYNGTTTITAGVLRASLGNSLSPSTNLALNGGIFQSSGVLNMNLGSAGGELRFTGGAANGGFSAAGASLFVNLNGGATLVWGSTTNFLGTGSLLLGTASGDNTVELMNPLDLGGGSRVVTLVNTSAEVDGRLSGAIGNGSLQLTGANGVIVELTGSNTYAGATTVANATLRLSGDASTAFASYTGNLLLTSAGGGQTAVLQTSGTVNRTIGSGGSQLRFGGTAGSQGFAATTAPLTLQLGALQWGTTDFFAGSTAVLHLNSATASAMTELQSNLDLNTGATRSIIVNDNVNSADDFARISGSITSSVAGATLVKTGTGLLELTGAGNTTNWQVNAGSLRAAGAALTTNNIALNGGVFESGGTFARSLGTGAGQTQWLGAGGYSAAGSSLTVNLNSGVTLTWGTTTNFIPTGSNLLFGSAFATDRVIFENPIDLNAAGRTISVADNPNSANDAAVLTGIVSGAAATGRLLKSGTGTLILAANNTYVGITTVSAGTLQIGDGGTSGSVAGAIVNRSIVSFSRSDTLIHAGVISNTGAVTNVGLGTVVFTGANTYTGGTTLSSGVLQIGNGGTAGSIVGDVVNNAVLAFNRSDVPTFAGAIGGGGTLLIAGPGGIELTGSNTYTGNTTIANGTLRLSGNAADSLLNTYTGNLSFATSTGQNALLQVSGVLSRSIGSGTGQVSFGGTAGTAGFSASGGNLTLQLGPVQWGAADFFSASTASLALSSASATALTEWLGDIDLNTATTRGVIVADNASSQADFARIGGAVTSSLAGGTLAKSGAGLLEFTNTANSANWQIDAGAVRAVAAAITSGNLTINGGVLESNGSITRRLGSAGNQLRWIGPGGFASSGGALTVNLDTDGNLGTLNTLTWNTTAGFVATGDALVFNSIFADGRVELQNPIALGTANRVITVNDNPNLSTDLAVISGTISSGVNGRITKNGAGTLVLSANNTYSGITTINAGTLQIGDGGTTGGLAGDIAVNAALVVHRSNDYTYAGVLSGNGSIIKLGGNVLTLTGVNTFGGTTTINAGTLQIGNGGATGAIGGNIVNNGFLIFNRDNFAPINFGGVISGTGGVQLLGGANSYSGATTVSTGTLIVSGSLTGSLVIVANGGTLAGSGNLSGVEVRNGGEYAPGNSPATQNVDGIFTLNSGAHWNIDLLGPLISAAANTGLSGTAGTNNDYLAGITSLDIADGAIIRLLGLSSTGPDTQGAVSGFNQANAYSLKIAAFASLTQLGNVVFDLAGFTNFNSIGAGSFSLGTSGGNLFLNYTPGASAKNLTWTGSINGQWNTTTANWTGEANTFAEGDHVTFNDSALNKTIDVISPRSPGSVTVDNSSGSTNIYTFNNAKITGTTGLLKQGAGTLILTNDNDYSGTTTIDGGTLQLGNGGATGGITSNVVNNGLLAFDRSNVFSYSGAISGTGGVVQQGDGVTRLLGANTYAGGTTVTSGMLHYRGSLNAAAGNFIVQSGATLLLDATITTGGTLQLDSDAALRVGSNAANTDDGVGQANLNLGSAATWSAGSSIVFQFRNSDTSGGLQFEEGTDWDLIDFGGSVVTIQGTAADRITVYVESFLPLNAGIGAAANFSDAADADPLTPGIQPVEYLWRFAKTGGISLSPGDDALSRRFVINDEGVFNGTTGFTRPTSSLGQGTFYVTQKGNDLYVGYSSIPEPSSIVFGIVSAAGMFVAYRRRKRQTNTGDSPAAANIDAICSASNATDRLTTIDDR